MSVKMAEILFEFRQVGNCVKVTAIDSASGVEVSIVGSPTLTRYSLQQAALRKLKHVLEKKRK
ncbi:MAG: hypothetical protein JXQ84_00595 [Rhodospirillaceae bacterium]|nr:hypothetical protein [Rhodospirillaceae bacterium]